MSVGRAIRTGQRIATGIGPVVNAEIPGDMEERIGYWAGVLGYMLGMVAASVGPEATRGIVTTALRAHDKALLENTPH